MDINPFEIAGKTVRRSHESGVDAFMYAEHCFWNAMPTKPLIGDLGYAKGGSDNIMASAKAALSHNDTDEAAHQLKREVYFCSIIDELAGTKNELAARAGLKAIELGLPPIAVNVRMDLATDDPIKDGFYTREPDVIDQQLNSINDWYKRDYWGAAKYTMGLRETVRLEKGSNSLSLSRDAEYLAMIDFAMADQKAKLNDPLSAKTYYSEAIDAMTTAKRAGGNIENLRKIAGRVGLHIQE